LKIRTVIAAAVLAATIIPSLVYAEAVPSPAVNATPSPAVNTNTAPAVTAIPVTAVNANPAAAVTANPEEAATALAKENALLKDKLKALECSISSTDLAERNCKRLKEIAGDIRAQRQGMADFENYVKWMSTNVSGYSKYLSAGSVAAGFAKVLPIPYAGQASVFAKFVTSAALSLSATSSSINKYLATSQQFISRTEKLDPSKGVNPVEVSELVRFADQDLLKEMAEVQEHLVSTSELTSSSLAFLESLNHYVGSTDQYWSKTKSLLKSGDEKNEKSFLAESTAALKNRAQTFNSKFKLFEQTVKKDAPLIKSLVAYDDLIRDIDPKVAKLK
jgi:hypothetical protein